MSKLETLETIETNLTTSMSTKKEQQPVFRKLVSFDDITELAINMPGCKCLLNYTSSNDKKEV